MSSYCHHTDTYAATRDDKKQFSTVTIDCVYAQPTINDSWNLFETILKKKEKKKQKKKGRINVSFDRIKIIY